MDKTISPSDKFLSKVLKTETCWIWQGGKTKAGYGISRSIFPPHNIGMAALVAKEIYDNLHLPGRRVLQTCGNFLCVHPEHITLEDSKSKSVKKKISIPATLPIKPINGKNNISLTLPIESSGIYKTDYGSSRYKVTFNIKVHVAITKTKQMIITPDFTGIPNYMLPLDQYKDQIEGKVHYILKNKNLI